MLLGDPLWCVCVSSQLVLQPAGKGVRPDIGNRAYENFCVGKRCVCEFELAIIRSFMQQRSVNPIASQAVR